MTIDLEEMTNGLPPEALPVLQKAGYFDADRLDIGSAVPAITLSPRAGGRPVTIGSPGRDKPAVLIFGSYT